MEITNSWDGQRLIIRQSLRKLVPGKISVRKGRGTASAWIAITGPGEFGNFEPNQIAVLVELGLLHSRTVNTNYAQIAPDSRKYWAEKLSRWANAPRRNFSIDAEDELLGPDVLTECCPYPYP